MNGLHLLLVALLLHRALVWREERRDRDLLLGALLGGLCVSNHGLAITVVPIVVAVRARRRPARDRGRGRCLLVKAGAAFALGLLPYLYLPLRALAGPAEVYGPFLTLEGLLRPHQRRAVPRRHALRLDRERPGRLGGDAAGRRTTSLALSNPVFVALGVFGIALLVLRDRWFGWLLVLLGVINVYFYANYLGDLSHYLLTSWLILAIGLGRTPARRSSQLVVRRGRASAGLWSPTRCCSCRSSCSRRTGRPTTSRPTTTASGSRPRCSPRCPQDAVLLTYWDALTPLSYKHCVEGVRPDVSLRAYDEKALVTCDPVERPLTEVARRRPVYALLVVDDSIQERTGLDAGPGPGHSCCRGASAIRNSIARCTGWCPPDQAP